jgi:hypothetical protein
VPDAGPATASASLELAPPANRTRDRGIRLAPGLLQRQPALPCKRLQLSPQKPPSVLRHQFVKFPLLCLGEAASVLQVEQRGEVLRLVLVEVTFLALAVGRICPYRNRLDVEEFATLDSEHCRGRSGGGEVGPIDRPARHCASSPTLRVHG